MFPHDTSLVLPDPPRVITLWITTVGVDTIDHNPTTVVALGNDTHYTIVPLYNGKPMFVAMLTSLVYVGNISNNNMTIYVLGSLILEKVCNKIMICNRGTNAHVQIAFVSHRHQRHRDDTHQHHRERRCLRPHHLERQDRPEDRQCIASLRDV